MNDQTWSAETHKGGMLFNSQKKEEKKSLLNRGILSKTHKKVRLSFEFNGFFITISRQSSWSSNWKKLQVCNVYTDLSHKPLSMDQKKWLELLQFAETMQ